MSCGQNDTKQKELELKERELALKEKEFALKQKDSALTQTNTSTKPVQQISTSNIGTNFIGLWKHRGSLNGIGEINIDFIKITKENNGRLKFKKGFYSINKDGNDNKSEQDIMWETDQGIGSDVYPKLLNDKLKGKYRIGEGSAPDAYTDVAFTVELKANNLLLYKSSLKNAYKSNGNDNESFEATKIK